MKIPGTSQIVSFLVGGVTGVVGAVLWTTWREETGVIARVAPPRSLESRVVVKDHDGASSVAEVAKGGGSAKGPSDQMNLDLPESTLREFSRYLRFPPLNQKNAFEPSAELIQLFGLTEEQAAGVAKSIRLAFEAFAQAELANAELCRDEVKGEFFKIRPLEESAQIKAQFSKMVIENLGVAKGLAVASILTNSGLFADFGSYPRIMYLDEKTADDGSAYFMLTQKRISDDLDEGRREFGSSSMFMSQADIKRRLGRLYETLEKK